MKFSTALIPATLVKRYKRFFVDCLLEDGSLVTAHCPNTGPMTGLLEPGSLVWLEPNDDPKKKLKYGWRLLEAEPGVFVGTDTSVPNRVVKEALETGSVAELAPYRSLRAEVKYGSNSRIDFLLSADDRAEAYVEVKSVTLMRKKGLAEFPDTVTTRGTKHLADLTEMARLGHRAVMLYLVQRTDCDRFAVAGDLDPAYAAGLEIARAAGVECLVYSCEMSPEEISLGRALPAAH